MAKKIARHGFTSVASKGHPYWTNSHGNWWTSLSECHYHSKSCSAQGIRTLSYCKTGLVLGCSKYTPNGRLNLYFRYRVQKAVELFKAGKVQYLIVSGDNHKNTYDEPTDMKNALVELGVPENQIYCDYAGFSTLDSVVRADKIFGQKELIVVSQDFHNQRAVFIGRTKGMELYGLNAKSVYVTYSRMTLVREALARVKTLLDVSILQRKPRFLGEPVQVG